MKKIDKMLADYSGPKPARQLSSNFTQKIISEIERRPRPQSRWAMFKEMIPMKTLPKPTATAIAAFAVIALSGTAYALYAWLPANVHLGDAKTLPNGNRVLALSAENCNYFGSKPQGGQEAIYYEVKKDSTLSNQQAIAMMQGICEDNQVDAVVSSIIKSLDDVDNPLRGIGYIVQSVDDKSIVVTQPSSGQEATTYAIGKAVKVYDRQNSSTLNTIAVGDTVALIAEDHHALPAERDLQVSDHMSNPEQIVLRAIVKTPKYTGDSSTFYKHLGKDFVRTDPCGDGNFCRAYEFDK